MSLIIIKEFIYYEKIKYIYYLFFCLLTVGAQQVSLQDVANRTYHAEGIRGIKPMLDGEHYTQMSADGKKSYSILSRPAKKQVPSSM